MSELRALRWRDLDFSKRLVHVRRGFTRWELGDTKSHKVRSVPMIDQVLTALDGLSRRPDFVEDEDWSFRTRSATSSMTRSCGAASSRRSIEPASSGSAFTTFDTRFGTLAVQAFPLSDVKAYMGHADIQTTMIYVHHVLQHDAAERLSRTVAGSDDFPQAVDQPKRKAA
jgi:integrase